MKRGFVQAKNPIEKRANAKIVGMNGRYFLIGGMTVSKNTCDIFQFRISKPEEEKYQVEWRPLKFQNHVFTPRNSFAACASSTHLYIWGGMELNEQQMTQKCLSDLIQVDIQKGRMRVLPLKQKIPIHSSCLLYDKESNSLVSFGGTNQQTTLEAYLCTLSLDIKQQQQYQWKRKKVKNVSKQGIIWQHSCNITDKSIFTGKQGKFMQVVGGCRLPHSPFKSVIQFSLDNLEISQSLQLQQAVVAHQTVYDPKNSILYIIGGSNGGGFNRMIYQIKQGKVQKFQGHNAVGCSSILTEFGLIVYGGVFMPEMLNDMIIYHY